MKRAKHKGKTTLVAILGLFTASVFAHLYNQHDTVQIDQIGLYALYDGIYLPSCKAALVNGSIITASHCFGSAKDPKQLFIKSNNTYKHLNAPSYRGNYDGFKGLDIAIVGNINTEAFGDCDDVAYFIDSNSSCKLSLFKNKSSNKRISTNCFMDRGESGTVLVNKQGKACLVYSGFYDIIDTNKNHNVKIGVFTPLKEINNE